jgi:dTDP-4-amino-4,6-dideoxygalactose transaminase
MEVLESREWGGYPFPNRLAARLAERFAAAHGARYGACVANGTVAIEIALRAIDLKPGEEVIIPAYTFEASAVPVVRLGGIPVFADVLPDTYCLDLRSAEALITPRTRAIIPVHLAMSMTDMDAVSGLAERYNLAVIEDCAHAHGSVWRGRGAGSLGTLGCFSMQTSKLMTCGEGGVVLTSDDEAFELCQSYINCGRASETDRFGHRIVGFNYRLTEFQAAVLLGQLERLTEQTKLREQRASELEAGLGQIPGIALLNHDPRNSPRAIYQYVFKYDAAAFGGASRDRFVAALEAEGFPCDGLFYEPVYRSALFPIKPQDLPGLRLGPTDPLPWQGTRCPVAERAAYEEAVWLPHKLLLGDQALVAELAEAVQKIQRNVDELIQAVHPLVDLKSMSRSSRGRR